MNNARCGHCDNDLYCASCAARDGLPESFPNGPEETAAYAEKLTKALAEWAKAYEKAGWGRKPIDVAPAAAPNVRDRKLYEVCVSLGVTVRRT